MSRTPARKKLDKLLDQRNEHPERLASIDAEIRATFERELAVLVLDMCGFSRLTIRHGIVHYLSMIRRMQRTVVPIVAAHQGHVVKTEADNLFATFENVPAAHACARAIQEALSSANRHLPEDWDIHVGIGIGFGPVLAIGPDDLYGSEMNLASKLGEDLAEAGDVLLTEAAFARVGRGKRAFVARRTRLGSLSLRYYGPRRRA